MHPKNCTRDVPLQGVYIPKFGKSSVKFLVLGSYTLIVAAMGLKFCTEEWTFRALLSDKFHPHRCNVLLMRGKKSQNWPLSNLNTGAFFALCAMLPVIRWIRYYR